MKTLFYIAMIVSVFIPGLSSSEEMQKNYVFEVLLNNKPIGTHSFAIEQLQDTTNVTTRADFDVKLLFINVYSYDHKNTETWKNDCLSQLYASTNDNGEQHSVKAEKLEDKILITSSGADTQDHYGCVRSFAYWDPKLLEADELLNPQTGKLQPAALKQLGKEKIAVQNRNVNAMRFQLETDDDTIDLWYDQNNEWIALESHIKKGKTLRYERRLAENES